MRKGLALGSLRANARAGRAYGAAEVATYNDP